MSGIETNFNLKSWKSRVLQLASELTIACANMPDSLRKDRMIDAMIKLLRAADMLDCARALADPEEVNLLLKLSVQDFRQKAQKKCQEIGGEVPLENGTGPRVNVSPFPKPLIQHSKPHGE